MPKGEKKTQVPFGCALSKIIGLEGNRRSFDSLRSLRVTDVFIKGKSKGKRNSKGKGKGKGNSKSKSSRRSFDSLRFAPVAQDDSAWEKRRRFSSPSVGRRAMNTQGRMTRSRSPSASLRAGFPFAQDDGRCFSFEEFQRAVV